MTDIKVIYNQIMTDLIKRGFGGYVQQLDHDYKNLTENQSVSTSKKTTKTKNESSTPISTPKNKNESPAAPIFINGGASSLYQEVL